MRLDRVKEDDDVIIFENESACKMDIKATLTYKLYVCKNENRIPSHVLDDVLYRRRLSHKSWSARGMISEKSIIKVITTRNDRSVRLTMSYCHV
jgi:hypothetical protein